MTDDITDYERAEEDWRRIAQGIELAEAFRSYQAALNDPSYWTLDGRERNQQQVGEAFDRLVQLTNTILGDV